MMRMCWRRDRIAMVGAAALALAACAVGGNAAEPKPVRHVDAKGAAQLVKEAKPVVLDVRTPREFKAGHVANAKNIDFNAEGFEKKIGELDRGATYLVYCQSGGRSTKSLETFKKLGFKSIIHLDGGYRGWEKAGQPFER